MSSLELGARRPVGKIAMQAVFRAIASLLAFALCIALLGCNGSRDRSLAPADPAWTGIISAHTTGPIARKSTIRIVFARDVVDAAEVGKPVDLLEVDPAIPGSVVFESPRELALKPRDELKPGASYRIALRARGLTGVSPRLRNYEFVVQVQRPQFDIRFDGLTAAIARDSEMTLRGEIATADSERAELVEKLLVADHGGQLKRIEWQHSANGLKHAFTIAGLVRAEGETTLTLAWDGRSIGSSLQGRRTYSVPGKSEFALTQVFAQGDSGVASERNLALYFSDVLDATQDLRGLIRINGATAPRLRIDGNVIHAYVGEKITGDVTVIVEGGVRNRRGDTLGKTETHTVAFAIEKPQVRWVGTGVILPEAGKDTPLAVPFEVVNVRAVRVTAFRVYEDNLPQFLQVNALAGQRELGRVGRYLWRKTLQLSTPEASENTAGRWQRYSLDLTELMQKETGGLIRLQLSFTRGDIVNQCGDASAANTEPPLQDADGNDQADRTIWDWVDEYYDNEVVHWSERDDPCKPAYYRYAPNTKAARNFVLSNIGLIAKRDQHGELFIAATDLRTAAPLSGVKVAALNYQNQTLASATTALNGLAKLKSSTAPYLLVAEQGGRKGYLRLAPGVALPISHFDVGGEKVAAGIKATIYGERGVWRPGDAIYLTLAVQDLERTLPARHPVTMELYNPQSQMVQRLVNDQPVGGFYAFTLTTPADAQTGDWTAKALLGGTTFTKTLKIETVMPNRLKIDLAMDELDLAKALHGSLKAQWLTGSNAGNLHADVKMRLSATATKFDRFVDFDFDDPARDFSAEPETLFEGELDADGKTVITKQLALTKQAPGMLNASLTTRVFERGGAFSINRQTEVVSPYRRYIGLKLPKGDVSRNMLLTDTSHTVELASLSKDGTPVDVDDIAITIYKIHWRWWWDQSGDALAQYAAATDTMVVETGHAKTTDGVGRWTFAIKYPEWGRYLIRACDREGGHCTGRVFYIDWPYWAGRPQDQSGPGANALAIVADKSEYRVGETAHIDLPEGSSGRALLTIENGSRILDARWLDVKDGARRIDLPLTAAMSPNVYAGITLLQGHSGKLNDRPIRMYGVVPIKVSDPKTLLHPELVTAQEWQPESTVTVEVREHDRRAMNYTLAIVDEGLLGLTNFKTPALHDHFYKREALGIATWDCFDEVVGAYGASLERLLALGGSDRTETDPEKNKSRFPPVVRFLGPFALAGGATAKHEVKLPQYVGAVRVMLIAGNEGAYGTADATVPVRQGLMLLPTLPRVVAPDEEIAVPISVFVSDASIKDVSVRIEADEHFAIVGSSNTTLAFAQPTERLAMLKIKSQSRIGKGSVRFFATSGTHEAHAEINLDVRSSNPTTAEVQTRALKPGESWKAQVLPHGLIGTNRVVLEMSATPPLNLESRLEYLVTYPYGCVEQTTSSAFPQLYLSSLTKLDLGRARQVESNVKAAIERLQGFQHADGGFAYWPGGWVYAADGGGPDPRLAWSTTYVGHFLLEAERLGYRVPESMRKGWVRFQRSAAQSWQPKFPADGASTLDQAYRLYTLALANQAEIGAMNRLREVKTLTTPARWMLAAAYKLAGLGDAAEKLTQGDPVRLEDYPYPDYTFGSRLRDTAIVLNAALELGKQDTKSLADAVSAELVTERWYSTQSIAYSLLAMSKFVGAGRVGPFSFERTYVGASGKIESSTPMQREELRGFPEAGGELTVRNTSDRTLFASVIVRGIAKAGDDKAAASGLELQVAYTNADGGPIDVARLNSGTDLIAHVAIKNTQVFTINNIALTHIVPAGFEIHNDRMDGVVPAGERSEPRSEVSVWRMARGERKAEYVDIRDDRVLSYFALNSGETIEFTLHLNAAYVGRYYLPAVSVEAMYDASKFARTRGQWVQVVGKATSNQRLAASQNGQ